jgi:hypothetical protein
MKKATTSNIILNVATALVLIAIVCFIIFAGAVLADFFWIARVNFMCLFFQITLRILVGCILLAILLAAFYEEDDIVTIKIKN